MPSCQQLAGLIQIEGFFPGILCHNQCCTSVTGMEHALKPPSDTDLKDFERIVAAHESAVRAFVAVRIDDPFEAHDLAQEVFILLWRKLGEIDLDKPLRPWLLGVSANLVRQHRRKGRAMPVGNDAILELLDDRVDEGEAIEGPALESLGHCLDKLDDAARQLVRWRYTDGVGIREICARTDSEHSSVTMKLHRLRSSLLDCIRSRMQEGAT